MFSRIAAARFSSASRIRGKASFESANIVTRKVSSVQIIRPGAGETRKLPPSSSAAASVAASRSGPAISPMTSIGLEEEGDQTEDERVEGDSLGEGESEPADALQLARHLGLARHRLDLLAEDDADADAGADRAEPGADS